MLRHTILCAGVLLALLGLLAACDGDSKAPPQTSGGVVINCLDRVVQTTDGQRVGRVVNAERVSGGTRLTVRQDTNSRNTTTTTTSGNAGDVTITIGDNTCGDRTHEPVIVQPTPTGPVTPGPAPTGG